MNFSKLLLLASLAIIPVCPATGMSISMGDNNNISIKQGLWSIIIRNSTGKTSVHNGQLTCDNCTALVELTKGSLKKIIECKQGTCTQTEYNTWTGKQILPESPLNSSEIAQKSPIFGFFANHPILGPVLAGGAALATGYGLYKLSKWIQKPKKQ
jgi:hypothetical protein